MATCDDVIEAARTSIGAATRSLLTGQGAAPARPDASRADAGLFGPASVTWRVHGDLSMLVGGLRALLLQTLHPLAMAAVAEHSDYRRDPLGRLHRTSAFLGTTTFGTSAAAEAAIATVRAIHERVVGIAPDGRPYRATDPHLLAWVHVTEVDSFLASYQRYGTATLTGPEADGYVAEMAMIGERLGAREVPRTATELDAWLSGVRPELVAGGQAREAVRFLLVPPLPLAARAPYGVIAAAAVELLPRWARRMLWLPKAPGTSVVVRAGAGSLLRTLGWALAPAAETGSDTTPTSTAA
ncbi:MAG: oxygenase MpaB family protein [Acidimicrobiales bacterium]